MKDELLELKEIIENCDVNISIEKHDKDVKINCTGDPEDIICVLITALNKVKRQYNIDETIFDKLVSFTMILDKIEEGLENNE